MTFYESKENESITNGKLDKEVTSNSKNGLNETNPVIGYPSGEDGAVLPDRD